MLAIDKVTGRLVRVIFNQSTDRVATIRLPDGSREIVAASQLSPL